MAIGTEVLSALLPRKAGGLDRDRLLVVVLALCSVALLLVFIAVPLGIMLAKSLTDRQGLFVGFGNYIAYFNSTGLRQSLLNSLTVSSLCTVVTVTLAFLYAYGVTRTRLPGRTLLKGIALLPLLAPSLLPAIALVYLFGKQGLIRDVMMGQEIYGLIGIMLGEIFYCFPHAFLILVTALSIADARHYEAAEALRASKPRIAWTVTLPGVKYGLISAAFVVFTMVITDFGVPKVIGGWYNVLATDIYKQVIGQQNFQMGAVVSMLLLLPAILAFTVDTVVRRKQVALLTARAVPYVPRVSRYRDVIYWVFCWAVACCLLGILGVAALASFVKFWPYNMELVLKHYDFADKDGGGWLAYTNSLQMAAWTAGLGTLFVFFGAWLTEKSTAPSPLRHAIHFCAMLPMAVPGLVLGLSYIFFFNAPGNPLGFLYQTMALLVICTVAHFYTVAHLTAATALKQMDGEFEAVGASLKVSPFVTLGRVTLPICLPALLDISIYLFVNALTTVSAVVFLYTPYTALASVAVLNMDDAGEKAPAAAMAMLIVYTAAGVRILHWLLTRGMLRASSRWRLR